MLTCKWITNNSGDGVASPMHFALCGKDSHTTDYCSEHQNWKNLYEQQRKGLDKQSTRTTTELKD